MSFQLNMEHIFGSSGDISNISDDIISTVATKLNTNITMAISNAISITVPSFPPPTTTMNETVQNYPGLIRKSVEDSTSPSSPTGYFCNQLPEPYFEPSYYNFRPSNPLFAAKSQMMNADKTPLHDLFQATFPNMETHWSNLYQGKSDLNPCLPRSSPSQLYQPTASTWQPTSTLTPSQWDGILSFSKLKDGANSDRNLVHLSDPSLHLELTRPDSDLFDKMTGLTNSSLNPCLPTHKLKIKHDHATESIQPNNYSNQTDISCQTNDCRETGQDLSMNTQILHRSSDLTAYQSARNNFGSSNILYNDQKPLMPTPSGSYFDSKYLFDPTVSDNPPSGKHKQQKGHIKKPLNAFMLFMREKRTEVMAECTLKESAVINQILGRKWHALSREEQSKYYEQARQEKELHQRLYPGWSARDNYACQARRKKRRTSKTDLFLLSKNRPDSKFKQSDDQLTLFKNSKTMDLPSCTVYGEHSNQWSSNAKLNYQTPVNISQPWKKNNLLNYNTSKQRDLVGGASSFPEPVNSFLVNPYPMGLLSVHPPMHSKISEADESSGFPKSACAHLQGDADKFTEDELGSDKEVYYNPRHANIPVCSVAKSHKSWIPQDSHHQSTQLNFQGDWSVNKSNNPLINTCLCYSHCHSDPNFAGPESAHPKPIPMNPDWSIPLSFRNPKPPVPDLLQSTCHPEYSPRQISSSESYNDRALNEDYESREDVNLTSVNYSTHVAATVAAAAAAAYALKTNCWSNTEFNINQGNASSLDYSDNRQTESYSSHTASTPESSLQISDDVQ